MQQFVQLLITGSAMGFVYALVAMAIALIVTAANLINFSTGQFVMLGGYWIVFFFDKLGLPYPVALLLGMLCMAITGFLFERIAYHPLRNADTLSIMICTIGMSMALTNLAQATWGAVPLYASPPLGQNTIQVGQVLIVPQHVLIIAFTIVLLVALNLFFEKTTLGRMAQAVAQDRLAASLMGIHPTSMITLTFMTSALIAGMGGILVAPVFIVSTTMGLSSILKGFSASVIGGWGSFVGAVAGGLFLGIVEVLLSAYVSSTYRDAFAFIILLLFLWVRPQGLFGERIGEKV